MAFAIRSAALAGALAATALVSTQSAAAAPVPGLVPAAPSAFGASRFDPGTTLADHYYCRWGCGRWDRGWRRDRVGAGDVILGAAIIGGIIAIASSANRRERDRDVVVYERDPRRSDSDWVRRDDPRAQGRPRLIGATSGLDTAVAMCVDAIERDVRVEAVDNAGRDASGWEVTGTVARGEGFRCRIGNDGRIDRIDYDRPRAEGSDGQWSADAYATARDQLGGTVRPDMAVQEAAPGPARGAAAAGSLATVTQPLPAYPGGPIPGEEIPENPPEPPRAD